MISALSNLGPLRAVQLIVPPEPGQERRLPRDERLKLELHNKKELVDGLPQVLGYRLKHRLRRANSAMEILQDCPAQSLSALNDRTLAKLGKKLLQPWPWESRQHGDERSTMFIKVVTAHGADAGHVEAILARVAPRGDRSLGHLQGPAAEQFKALRQSHQVVPGDWKGLQTYVDAATSTTQRAGTKVEPLVNGQTAFPVMLDAVDQAKDSINMMTFAFHSDDTGWEFARHLAAAADRGVAVKLTYDQFGSQSTQKQPTDPALFKYLQEHGGKLFEHDSGPVARQLDHRKIIVVDGEVGFIGGMNIGDEYHLHWHDVHSKVTGPGVADLQKVFVQNWEQEGGSAQEASIFPKLSAVPGGARARIVDKQGLDDWNMKLAYLRAVDTAQESINIATPYFSDQDVVDHLKAAAHRGVEVTVELPKVNNQKMAGHVARSFYPELLESGVHIREYHGRPMAHEKVATFDGKLATIGSSNLDARSLNNDDEANVWVADEKVAATLNRDLFQADQATSDVIGSYQLTILDRIAHAIKLLL